MARTHGRPTSVLPLKFDAEFLAVQDRGDAIDSSPRCRPNCVMCLRDGTLGSVNNTVLTLTTASLGFAVSRESSTWTQWALWVGTAFLLISVVFALCCAVNRLSDFRESARLARRKMDLAERRKRRCKNRRRGTWTWVLLHLQLWCFAIGATSVVIASVPWSKPTERSCPSTASELEPDRPAALRIPTPKSRCRPSPQSEGTKIRAGAPFDGLRCSKPLVQWARYTTCVRRRSPP